MSSPVEEAVSILANNLKIDREVKETLIDLETMEIPKDLLVKYNIEMLARRFMMTDGLKEEARKLMGKARKAVKEDGSSDEGFGGKRQKSMVMTEEMTASKRTAPKKMMGKKKKSSLGNMKPEEENPSIDEVEEQYKKFVYQEFPLAARYLKPAHFTWQKLYEQYAELRKEVDDTKKVEEKKAEEEERLKRIEEKKAAHERKKALDMKKAAEVTNTFNYMEECRKIRIQEAQMAKETGKWPVYEQKEKNKKRH